MNAETAVARADKSKPKAQVQRSQQSTALVPDIISTMTPDTYADMWKLAGHLSQSSIVPKALKDKPGAILSIMARGAYMGIPWPVAVQEAYVVFDKVCWPAAILAAVVATSPEFEYFDILEADDEHAVIEAKKHRWPKARLYEVDIEQARRAGYLDGKHSEQWVLRPRFMLIAMVRRESARMWDPVRCAGLYTIEELENGRRGKSTPAEAQAPLLQADFQEVEPETYEEAKSMTKEERWEEASGNAPPSEPSSVDLTALEKRVEAAGLTASVSGAYGALAVDWEKHVGAIIKRCEDAEAKASK